MNENYNEFEIYDAIFCRNVLIYFDANTQKIVIRKLLSRLKSGGYLFLGHSETVSSSMFDLQHVQPSVYIKK
jgi:chemotaxis protein methyltransferase CheR